MQRLYYLVLLFLVLCAGSCRKDEIPLSGTATIDNDLFGTGPYYAFGFSFALADKVPTSSKPFPDLIIDNDGTTDNLILQANTFKNSFFLAGEYNDAPSASAAFDNLTEPVATNWVVWAFGIEPNQVWIIRTAEEKYAKIRIISTVSELRENRNYAECTFEWVFQPDGTLSFPPG